MITSKEKDFNLFAKSKGIDPLTLSDYNKCISNSYIEPYIVEERKLNATQISVFSRLFIERTLFIGTDINSDVANIINSQLLYLEMENPEKPINIYINSPGGSVIDGMSIYDLMNYIQSPVSTTCIGLAASMGAVLLSSGNNGCRSALPNSRIMIHQPLNNPGYGQASDLEIANRETQLWKKVLYDVLSKNTGKTFDEIEKACDRNNWFTSDKAVEFGLIDKVISR